MVKLFNNYHTCSRPNIKVMAPTNPNLLKHSAYYLVWDLILEEFSSIYFEGLASKEEC